MAKKPTHSPTKKDKPRKRAVHGNTRRLTKGEVQRLAKPRDNYEDLVDKAVAAWMRQRVKVRVHKLSPARLAALVRKARRAQAKEKRMEDIVAKRLGPLQDRRLLADAAAWKALLELWSMVKPVGDKHPEVKDDFKFLAEALSSKRAAPEDPKPA